MAVFKLEPEFPLQVEIRIIHKSLPLTPSNLKIYSNFYRWVLFVRQKTVRLSVYNVHGQRSEHIFAQSGGYCSYSNSIYRVWRFSLSLVKQEWCSIVTKLQLILRYHLCRSERIPPLCSHMCHRRDFTKINLKPLVQILRKTWPGARPCPNSRICRVLRIQSCSLGAVSAVIFWRSSYLRVCSGTAFHVILKRLNFMAVSFH